MYLGPNVGSGEKGVETSSDRRRGTVRISIAFEEGEQFSVEWVELLRQHINIFLEEFGGKITAYAMDLEHLRGREDDGETS